MGRGRSPLPMTGFGAEPQQVKIIKVSSNKAGSKSGQKQVFGAILGAISSTKCDR